MIRASGARGREFDSPYSPFGQTLTVASIIAGIQQGSGLRRGFSSSTLILPQTLETTHPVLPLAGFKALGINVTIAIYMYSQSLSRTLVRVSATIVYALVVDQTRLKQFDCLSFAAAILPRRRVTEHLQ
jgi:hypothetical protein